ncbi:hypothetical protein J6590_060496 [Homalodisca vitripennis]|nr:hypothetical protein J6590_060496 [Homalodisca vitripennis]
MKMTNFPKNVIFFAYSGSARWRGERFVSVSDQSGSSPATPAIVATLPANGDVPGGASMRPSRSRPPPPLTGPRATRNASTRRRRSMVMSSMSSLQEGVRTRVCLRPAASYCVKIAP